MKFLLMLSAIYTLSNASYALGKKNYCIEDYFLDNGTFYYLKSDGMEWKHTTSKTYLATVENGWEYNTTNGNCYRKQVLVDLGIDWNTYNALMAFSAILFAIIVFYVLATFLVGV